MVKLSKEIDNINASLRKIGCEDTEIGGLLFVNSKCSERFDTDMLLIVQKPAQKIKLVKQFLSNPSTERV